jgi:hypothetical protein
MEELGEEPTFTLLPRTAVAPKQMFNSTPHSGPNEFGKLIGKQETGAGYTCAANSSDSRIERGMGLLKCATDNRVCESAIRA